jgi:hypothetical protein
MKILTATFVALIAAGFCAAPLALAQDNSAVEAKLKANEDAWAAAQLKADSRASTVGAMLATDYAGVGAKGQMRDKAGELEHMKTDTDTYTASANDTMKVHVYGPTIATVSGTSTEKGKDKDGKEFNRSFAWLDTWMERNGAWQCVGSSGTALVK